MRGVCWYHGSDFDGVCSAALIDLAWQRKAIVQHPQDLELVPVDYGRPMPADPPADAMLIIVDWFPPMDDLLALAKRHIGRILVFDHHDTARRAFVQRGAELPDRCEVTFASPSVLSCPDEYPLAACELIQGHLLGDDMNAHAVAEMVGRWDTWRHDENVVAFQYGLRSNHQSSNPRGYVWNSLLGPFRDDQEITFADILASGRCVVQYASQQALMAIRATGFGVNLDGHVAFAVMGVLDSKAWDWWPHGEDYDVLISYYRQPEGQWKVSLRTRKPGIDVAAIAAAHGGGGHRAAAGFHCDWPPFLWCEHCGPRV